MTVRIATLADLSEIVEVYSIARRFMSDNGNPHQWGDGKYPPESLLKEDILKKQLYVVDCDGRIEGVFIFALGPDNDYLFIDGEWLNSDPYAVIHRVASSGRAKGILKTAVDFATQRSKNIKIDTHEQNTVMQRALEKLGFKRCGIIHLENGEPRLAYQLSL